jgi:uncharacterized protein YdeI (YjbR/CyaY-like superfamily)
MGQKDKRVDEYILKSQPFAQPILTHVRDLVHRACPEVVENIKWGMPAFEYKGPYVSMAAFKQHCTLGFWKTKLLNDPKGYLGERKNQGGEAMGNFGCLKDVSDLPPDKVILDFLKQAKKLNDDGIKLPTVAKRRAEPVELPPVLMKAFKQNKEAKKHFDAFSPSHKREYLQWINEAKTEPTRDRRVAQAIQWMAEGKSRNWKYERKK